MKQLPFIQELTEARLFYDVKDIKNMTAKEIAEIVYYIFLLIEVWRLNKPSEAAKYATQTLGYDDYRTMHYSATDLANLLSVLNNQDVFSGHIKIQADISIPLFQINRYLRDVARQSKSSTSEDQTFFWRLEDYLKVYGNSTIRQLRRDISNWTDLTYANKIQALSILRREFDKRGSSVDLYLRFKQEFKLNESIEIPIINNSIQYHKTLNPKLWNNEELHEDVKKSLLKIAKKFTEFLDVEKFKIIDYIITGSNCAFNYTSHSDIDLHVLLDTSSLTDDTLTEPFLMAKKSLWNSGHDITVKGYNIELYAEDIDAKDTLVATGIYSLLEDKWIKKPKYEEITIDDTAVKSKVTDIIHRINDTIETKSADDLEKLMNQIRKMRWAGLEENGEFSVENLAFKVLRNGGYLDKIYEVINSEEDAELTLEGKAKTNVVPKDVKQKLANIISKNCKPFLKQINEGTPPLYRGQSAGLNQVEDRLFRSSTIENRKPKDTLINDHNIIDQWLFDHFGIKFRSNHIMFATGQKRVVNHYGKPYKVIPIGNFQFCWSLSIADSLDLVPKAYEIHYEMEEKYGIEDATEISEEQYKQYRAEINKEMIEKRLARGNYSTSNLDAAIKSENEVMIHCKEYFLLSVTDEEYEQIIKMARKMI